MPVDDRALVSEHILEIRYRALGKMIDRRGLIADEVSSRTNLTFWSITDNRVDFRLDEKATTEMAFVSHKNLGYTVRKPATRNYFPDRAMRFVRELLQVEGFDLQPVVRFGVRSRVLLPSTLEFAGLAERVQQIMPLHENHTKPFDAQLEDVGPVVILKRGALRIRVQSGPMTLEQSRVYLKDYEGLPEVGFFLDIDQYQADVGPMSERDVSAQLNRLHGQAWEAVDFYNRLLDW